MRLSMIHLSVPPSVFEERVNSEKCEQVECFIRNTLDMYEALQIESRRMQTSLIDGDVKTVQPLARVQTAVVIRAALGNVM